MSELLTALSLLLYIVFELAFVGGICRAIWEALKGNILKSFASIVGWIILIALVSFLEVMILAYLASKQNSKLALDILHTIDMEVEKIVE